MSLCPYVLMSLCPYVLMSLCPYVLMSLCPYGTGNASQLSDGASACVLMEEKEAQKLGTITPTPHTHLPYTYPTHTPTV